jgi:quinoprotein glucose dehydrogenase
VAGVVGARRPRQAVPEKIMKRFTLVVMTASALVASGRLSAQKDWASFGQDQAATRYSTLKQIDAANVKDLTRAWTFHTGVKAANEATALIINSVVYLSASNGYFAVDGVTGAQIWKFEATGTTQRGVSYWPGDARSPARIIGAATGNKIVALDAKTGQPVPEFGQSGFVDIGTRMQSPPAIYKELLIAPSMDRLVRAWNIRTGALAWTFNLVPQPGERGHETWESDAWKTSGGVNVWGHITVDSGLGMAFVPTAPPSPDYVGVNRPGNTLYGTSLVALDANTGTLKWYQQLVHHDLWDFDSAAAPTLVEIVRGGSRIPAVVHMGKTGLMYIFDRRDGKPVFGMEERAVPQSNVPGEKSSPTQPFPVKPEPIARVSMKKSELPTGITPELTAYCQGLWDKYNLDDTVAYSAWKLNQDILVFPGAVGGGNWQGTSFNPQLGLIFTNVMNAGQWGHIELRQPGAGRRGGRGPGGPGRSGDTPPAAGDLAPRQGGQAVPPDAPGLQGRAAGQRAAGGRGAGTQGGPDEESPAGPPTATGPSYGKVTPEGGRFWQPDTRYSCVAPPWGELVAVNANTGDIAWRATLGAFDELAAKGLKTGTPNLGGSIATAGNLIFIGATVDGRFRAFDARNGKELWSATVDAPAHSIPATYIGRDGKQYVVVSAAGGGFLRDPTSDAVVAFSLPDRGK